MKKAKLKFEEKRKKRAQAQEQARRQEGVSSVLRENVRLNAEMRREIALLKEQIVQLKQQQSAELARSPEPVVQES